MRELAGLYQVIKVRDTTTKRALLILLADDLAVHDAAWIKPRKRGTTVTGEYRARIDAEAAMPG